ncbi:MAG: Kef family K(+) transporter [Candidatus Accumulibacter sp.]|jgi:CPA2 family monovalent cation:H+ antiporter-2|nr:Kef family K(+) transporter [Accumulibacter sp.]
MGHNISLITTIASAFGIALIFGFIAERIRIPALVGYLLAGVLLGPGTPGFVADMELASQLSEIGVMLLMFGVGLHFSLEDLLAVKRIAIPGAIAQMTLATILGFCISLLWGWPLGNCLIFGLSLSCASTVVLLKALEALGVLDTMDGRIAVGWLVVEDLATVLILVLLPPLAGVLGSPAAVDPSHVSGPLWQEIGVTLLQVAAFIALMLIVGRRFLPWLLLQISRTGSRELFTLSVIAIAIGIAYGASALFNVSFALGAFFAGMVMRESEFSHRAAEESLPLRDAFSVLFFVSVGMLFEPSILIEQPFHLIAVISIIILGKSIAALSIVLFFRYSLHTALTVSASLAQVGEFSFILGGLGISLGVMTPEGMNLILAGSLISIALNPLLFMLITPLQKWILERYAFARKLEERGDPYAELPKTVERKYLEKQVVLVGYGRVGKRIASDLEARGIPYVVVEQNRERVEDLRTRDIVAVSGDASDPAVLIQAHVANAAMLVIATPDPVNVRQMADTARTLNPSIEIILRTHSEDESQSLRESGFGIVFFGEEELARSMAEHIIERFAPPTTGEEARTAAEFAVKTAETVETLEAAATQAS